MASLPDPSAFALSVAAGYAHVLRSVPCSAGNPVLGVLLALPLATAYLAAVTLAFAVRVAGGVYAHVVVVACSCHGGDGDAAASMAEQAAALLSPAAAVLGWVASTVAKLAVALLIFSGLAVALFRFSLVVLLE